MMHWVDETRRGIGWAMDAIGLRAQETAHAVAGEFPGARLRVYDERQDGNGPVLLIIPAPFKRAYIWDLLQEVSVVRHCLRRGIVRCYFCRSPSRAGQRLGPSRCTSRFRS